LIVEIIMQPRKHHVTNFLRSPKLGIHWRRNIARAMGLIWVLSLLAHFAGTAHAQTVPADVETPPPPAMVPLLPDDAIKDGSVCKSTIYANTGERLALVDGTNLLVRLNSPVFPGPGGHAASPMVYFSNREKTRSLGTYGFEFFGFGALDSTRKYHEYLYTIKIQVSDRQACPTAEDWLCNDYTGTLDFSAVYSPYRTGKYISTQQPQLAIKLHDECPARVYKHGGLFGFPGFLDYLGGFILGGH